MDYSHKLSLSYYKTTAVLNEDHKIYMVQHQLTNKIYVKKIIDIYNPKVYEYLATNKIKGIPPIIDCFEEDNQLILIEEYISGDSLQEKLNNSKLDVNSIKKYMIELCSILEQLHSLNPPIIHRDIKPTNVIITPFDNLVLLDFNAAKYHTDGTSQDTVLLGTKGYAAPEQYGFGTSSPQTDIYALGIMLKELVHSLNEHTVIYDKIINKSTKLDPKDRFQSVTAFKNALLDINITEDEPTRKPSGKYTLPGFRTRTPWKMLIASFSYMLIIYVSSKVQVENTTSIALYLNRLIYFAVMIMIVFICTNYMNIHHYTPLNKSKYKILRYIGIVFFCVLVCLTLILLLIIIEPFFPGSPR